MGGRIVHFSTNFVHKHTKTGAPNLDAQDGEEIDLFSANSGRATVAGPAPLRSCEEELAAYIAFQPVVEHIDPKVKGDEFTKVAKWWRMYGDMFPTLFRLYRDLW